MFLLLVALDGCGHAPPQVPLASEVSATPPWLAAPLEAPAATPNQTPVEALPGTVVDPAQPVFDPATIVAVLGDPRLLQVKALATRGAFKGAADKLLALLRDSPPDAKTEPSWQYQLGMLRWRAGDPLAAIGAFDRAAAVDWALKDYARMHAAELLLQVAQPAEAAARLQQIATGTVIEQEVKLARAQALAAQRKVDAAARLWDAYLAKRPRPKGWQLVALRYARALVNQPTLPHAERAVEVTRGVIFASSRGRGVGEARKLEKQALLSLPSTRRSRFHQPDLQELMTRARNLSEARQGREAVAAAKVLIRKLVKDGVEDTTASELSCEAYLARAKGLATVRRYSEASKAAGIAIKRCKGHGRQVVALFLGGRYALRGGTAALARKRYAQLEKRFPKHSYADDARLHGAEAALDLGDVAAFTRMLSRIDTAYPHGDMVDQALFTLARDRIERGDWAGAVAPLERAIKKQWRGRPYYAEGRPQYFLARAKLKLRAADEGRRLLAQVVRDFPLSYYMVLAYDRLARHDPKMAARVLSEAQSAEPQGDFVIADHAELHRPAFLRAVELVRQGDGPRALAELDSLGVRNKKAHPSLLWASAFLLSQIEAPAESHGVLRSSTELWKEHYPAGIWRSVWEVAYPRPFAKIVAAETKRSGIAGHLAFAIIREESAFKPRVVSSANAYGLMQLIEPTAKRMARKLKLPATIEALKRPKINIALGCRFLSILQRQFAYNPLLAIPGYNAGPGAPARWVKKRPAEDFDVWVERIPYKETRRYTKRVIRTMAAYANLYGAGMHAELLRNVPLVVKPDN